MTNYQFYQKSRDILHHLNDAALLQELKFSLVDGDAPREMRPEDLSIALNLIDKHLAWLRSIYYPATKAELKFRQFIEQERLAPSKA